MVNKEQQQAGADTGRCPICKEPTETAYRPFCSARCRDVDLSRWLRGGYAIPGAEPTPGESAASRDDADEE